MIITVYVDDMRRSATVGRVRGRWSHLFTDQDDQTELHEFARRIGLQRAWFQGAKWETTHPWRCHYDVTDALRERALAQGATEITYPGGLAELLYRRRQERYPS